jgi:uncharacterized protein YndB with AHSA1/START domain
MTTAQRDSFEDSTGREMVITRVFDAPRVLIWKAWTDPAHVGHWWGPNGFTTTIREMDVRPGGVWRYVMHGPDGTDYGNRIDYLEVVKPERLEYMHGGDDGDESPPFRVTVTFGEDGGRTRVTMRAVFVSVEEFERVKAFGAVEGGKQTFERLAGYLPKM